MGGNRSVSRLGVSHAAVKGATVFVTGGGRGIGKALVEEVYARGAAKVYATARDPRTVAHSDAVPLALEVTDAESVIAAAQAQDVTILINNAGASAGASYLDSPMEDVRKDLETNFYGPLLVTRAIAPIIERNGGGHILNVHSALSWLADGTPYSASKAAFWSQTNSLRLQLPPRGIAVTGLHVAYLDTDMTSGLDAPKAKPRDVAVAALDGIEAGAHEVLADDPTRWVKSQLSADLEALYAQLKK
ncbi:SDR family oxidoreductase [Streptomyces sp. ME19-01-6]|uniref:SDR family oxidoreductase n=1 Tax=Streptomyces sp. ME19-01-6 TaxID=3028686 RepID=UPI0029BBA76F|nr:SDR family oxidoreductase [Streptomyces sp. ME19-01-6]MDX3233526.1 SDR family oxidoreductase [Streptomyces sp. ME19-01-6]